MALNVFNQHFKAQCTTLGTLNSCNQLYMHMGISFIFYPHFKCDNNQAIILLYYIARNSYEFAYNSTNIQALHKHLSQHWTLFFQIRVIMASTRKDCIFSFFLKY